MRKLVAAGFTPARTSWWSFAVPNVAARTREGYGYSADELSGPGWIRGNGIAAG